MPSNPLATRAQPPPVDPALMRHAQMWKAMHGQEPDALHKAVQTLDYGLPILGALAGNPKTTAKDVIKATSGAVADGKLAPSAGVAFITQMPADPDKLHGWLRDKYASNLAAAVHAKAALMAKAGMPQGTGVVPPGVRASTCRIW